MILLLDTNAYTAFKRKHLRVAHMVRRARLIQMSAVVIGELLYGFRHGTRFDQNWRDLELFLGRQRVSWLPVTLSTADRYGRIAAQLRRKGTLIPTNDIWIAAHAMETGADLLTFDRHFERVDGLAVTFPDQ